MNPRVTAATALRVLTQLRRDPRTVALLLAMPCVLMVLTRYIFSREVFDRLGPAVLGLFPLVVMFAVTAVATLRERTAGTLERLLTMPAGRLDLLVGYALAFGAAALVEVGLLVAFSLTLLGLDVDGHVALLVLVAVLGGLVGMALGLFVSVFARTEFQVGQFMPAFVLPQLLMSGLFGPRADMAAVLRWISDVFPMTYVIDAMQRVTAGEGLSGAMWRNLAILVGTCVLALALGAATLRRRSV